MLGFKAQGYVVSGEVAPVPSILIWSGYKTEITSKPPKLPGPKPQAPPIQSTIKVLLGSLSVSKLRCPKDTKRPSLRGGCVQEHPALTRKATTEEARPFDP